MSHCLAHPRAEFQNLLVGPAGSHCDCAPAIASEFRYAWGQAGKMETFLGDSKSFAFLGEMAGRFAGVQKHHRTAIQGG